VTLRNFFVEKFLPLANHAEITIVNDGDIDLQILLHHRRQFAHGHLEFRHRPTTTQTSASGRAAFTPIAAGNAKSMVPRSAGRDQRTWPLVLVVLRFPHLCWPTSVTNHGVCVLRFMPQIVDHMRGIQMPLSGKF